MPLLAGTDPAITTAVFVFFNGAGCSGSGSAAAKAAAAAAEEEEEEGGLDDEGDDGDAVVELEADEDDRLARPPTNRRKEDFLLGAGSGKSPPSCGGTSAPTPFLRSSLARALRESICRSTLSTIITCGGWAFSRLRERRMESRRISRACRLNSMVKEQE